LPVPFLGVHIDNGGEFLNAALVGYCRRHQIQLSRGRPFHVNDIPHIEQKNGYLVRRQLSNLRLDNAEQLAWLDHLYSELLRPSTTASSRSCRPWAGSRSASIRDGSMTPRGAHSSVSWRPARPTPSRSRGLVRLYTSVSPLTLKRCIDRHLRTMPADHYSSPTQRSMVAGHA
jgi:hypothetical protein